MRDKVRQHFGFFVLLLLILSFPIVALAQAAPPADQEVGGFIQKFFTNILGGQWWIAASVGLMFVVWFLRREQGFLVKAVPFFGTTGGGWLLGFTVAFVGGLGDALAGGQAPTLEVVRQVALKALQVFAGAAVAFEAAKDLGLKKSSADSQ